MYDGMGSWKPGIFVRGILGASSELLRTGKVWLRFGLVVLRGTQFSVVGQPDGGVFSLPSVCGRGQVIQPHLPPALDDSACHAVQKSSELGNERSDVTDARMGYVSSGQLATQSRAVVVP